MVFISLIFTGYERIGLTLKTTFDTCSHSSKKFKKILLRTCSMAFLSFNFCVA